MGRKYSLFSCIFCLSSTLEFIHQAQQYNPDTKYIKDIYLHVYFVHVHLYTILCMFAYLFIENYKIAQNRLLNLFQVLLTELQKLQSQVEQPHLKNPPN